MVVGLLLAAAVTTAPKPLFAAPKGMISVSADPSARREIARTRGGVFVRAYRGFTAIKPAWSKFTYKTPETVVVAAYPTVINAAEWGAESFERVQLSNASPALVAWCSRQPHCRLGLPAVKKIAAQAVALCNGQRGRLNAFTRGNETYEQLFARSRNRMYVATLRYQTDSSDTLHAAQSLRTLCPPGAGELPAPTTAVPFAPPRGWTRSTNTASAFPGYALLGDWYRVPTGSLTLETLHIWSASDVSEYTTPGQMAAAWKDEMRESFSHVRVLSDHGLKLCSGADAWVTRFQAPGPDGLSYAIQNMYAYGGDNLYILQYARPADTLEDPDAYKALYSLCPPHATDGT